VLLSRLGAHSKRLFVGEKTFWPKMKPLRTPKIDLVPPSLAEIVDKGMKKPREEVRQCQ
jgi:hypothetical protein